MGKTPQFGVSLSQGLHLKSVCTFRPNTDEAGKMKYSKKVFKKQKGSDTTALFGDSVGWESRDGEPTPVTGRGCVEGCAGKGSEVRCRPKGAKSSD